MLPEFPYESLWFDHFTKEILYVEEKSETPSAEWRASGRASKSWPDKENEEWWWENGPKFVESYRDWRESNNYITWTTPAGEPAIELDIRCSFDGIPVRSIIDRVFVTDTGELAVVDIKSGANPPQDQGLQLGWYASALEVVFGVRPSIACYWNARKGGLSVPAQVDHLTPDYIGGEIRKFIKGVENKIFIPHPSSFCSSCGVRRACPLVNGEEASLYVEK